MNLLDRPHVGTTEVAMVVESENIYSVLFVAWTSNRKKSLLLWTNYTATGPSSDCSIYLSYFDWPSRHGPSVPKVVG